MTGVRWLEQMCVWVVQGYALSWAVGVLRPRMRAWWRRQRERLRS